MCADVIFSCFASQRCMVVSKWFRLRQQWQSYGICISMCHLGFYRNNQHRTLETSVILWMRHQMVTGSKVWFTRMSTTLSINLISDALCVTNKRITCYLLILIYLFYIMEKHLELHQQQLKKKKKKKKEFGQHCYPDYSAPGQLRSGCPGQRGIWGTAMDH